MLNLKTLLEIPYVEMEMGFDISPDGNLVAFSWNRDGTWEIFQTTIHHKSEPVFLTKGKEGAKFHPRFSPDGRKIAYMVDEVGNEAYHLVIHDLENDHLQDVTKESDGNLQANFCWSPDGRKIAYISDKTGQFDVYLLDVESGESSHLLDAGFPAWKVLWSPDGKWIAVTVEAGGIDYNTVLILFDEKEPHVVIKESDTPIDAGQVAWSPDSKFIAFTSDYHGFNNVGLYDVHGQEISWLTGGEGEKQFPTWSPDGSCIAYIHNLGTTSWLAIHALGKTPSLYQVEQGVHYHPIFSKDGEHILLVFDNPCSPGDIWSYSINEGRFNQLTDSLPAFLDRTQFAMPEEIKYSGMDGKLVPALLFKPQGEKTGRAVIIIHGGPDWYFQMTWYPIMAHMASRGWVVLAPNYRGSTGYGRAWQESSRYDFGGVDNDDVAAGVDYLISNNLAHPKRIAVTGRSHGGYLTMTCMTKYPDRWAAGSAIVPFINWFTNHELIRPDLQHWDYENFGDPIKDHDLWVDRSPYFHLARVNAPVQLIAGRHDQRCPVTDSIEAYEMLQKLGKKAELIVYEDEGHAFLKKKNVIESEIKRVEFLAIYLEGDDQVISARDSQ